MVSPDEQTRANFVSLGSFRTLILPEHFHSSFKRVSVLKQKTRAKCLMKHTQERSLRDWRRPAGNRGRIREGRIFTSTMTPNAGVYKRR